MPKRRPRGLCGKEAFVPSCSGSNVNSKLFRVDACQEGMLIQLYIFKIYGNLEIKEVG